MNKNKITKDMIEFVLSEFEQARNDDLYLANKICEIYHIYILGLDWIKEANTITRMRRKLQQEGKYPSSEFIRKKRKKLQEVAREEYRPLGKNKIQELVIEHLMERIS